jgi:hypothetical protein
MATLPITTEDDDFGARDIPSEDDFGARDVAPVSAAQASLNSAFNKPASEAVSVAPEAAPEPERSFGERALRKGFAVASGISDVVPFAPQIIARLRTLKGPETYEEELAKVREEKAMIEEGEPVTTSASRTLGTLASIPAIGAGAGPVGAALRFGAYGGARAATQEGATAGDIAKSAAFNAAVPALFKGASSVARSLAPTTTTGALGTFGLRTAQTGVRAVPYGVMAEQPLRTLVSDTATPAEMTEAGINLLALPLAATQELRQGTRRAGLRQAESIRGRALPEAEALVTAEQEAAAAGEIRKQRTLEAEAETARARAAEEAISGQRQTETEAYEQGVKLETGREVQAARSAAEQARLVGEQRRSAEVQAERRAQLDAREQAAEQLRDEAQRAKARAEDDALTFAQQKQDVATEAKIWEQKNKRAMRAVKDEQRVISEAERLARGDQAAVTEMQAEITELKAMEDALTTGDDPSLRGAVAKKYQDMGNRLERALKFFKDGGVEPPPEYQQAYDSVRESYLRNTQAQGYVGFGPSNELFLEDPRAWAESERLRRLSKVEADRTGKEAAIVRFLEGIAQRDYMAESRTTKAGPQVPEQRIQELFGEQGLQYAGGPLVQSDGVPIKQPFLGGRVPRSPFTSPEVMAESVQRRRALQTEQDTLRTLMRDFRRTEARVPTASERARAERLAEIQAQQAAGFSGLTDKQAIEQAVRARTPVPAGMTEADILARAGIAPTPAVPMAEAAVRQAANITPAEAARIFAERRAAAERGLEYGTPRPEPTTLKRMDLDSATRAVYEMMKPEFLRGGVLARVPGLRIGGLTPGAEAPRYLGERVAEDPTQTRLGLPFQAFAMADRFARVLQRNANVKSRYDQFVRSAAKRGRGEDLQGFFQDVANFIAGDEEAAANMKAEEVGAP